MTITLNGKPYETDAPTLAVLIATLGVKGTFAMEVNGVIIHHSEFETTRLAAHDIIEVIQFVGGG